MSRDEPGREAKKPCTASSQQPACTHEARFCPPPRSLLLQVNFGIVKFTPQRLHSRSFWPHALTLIWRKMSSMHSGTSTLERGVIRQVFRTVPCSMPTNLQNAIFVLFPSNLQLCLLKNVTSYPPPPNPYISEMAFSHRFQKVYTYPEILAQQTKSLENSQNVPKPTVLTRSECPRETWSQINLK